jgi:hypothetical protein
VASGAASRVLDPDVLNASNLGVIAAPGGAGGYMVAELQNIVGCHEAELVCFSSQTGEWVTKDVANPLPRWIWSFYDVVSHDGKLWCSRSKRGEEPGEEPTAPSSSPYSVVVVLHRPTASTPTARVSHVFIFYTCSR